MPASVVQNQWGPTWPMGLVAVATPGTQVRATINVDANNTNAPETASNSTTHEYSPTISAFELGGWRVGANNVGLQPNQGNVYLLAWNANTGGGGNYADPGVILAVIPPGQTIQWPPTEIMGGYISPYAYGFDADNANDSVLVTAVRR